MIGGVGEPSVTVVLMTYDEAASLEWVTRELKASLVKIDREHELLIVNDGSHDGSGEIADRLSSTIPGVRVIHHASNLGLGGVYRTGFSHARGDLVTFFPADGQFPASILESFVPQMSETDMVLGYVLRRYDFLGLAFSTAERAIYAVLFGRLPRFQGVLMFRRHLLAQLTLRSEGRGWAVIMELIVRARRAGWRLRSLPTPIRPRRSGTSKVQNLSTVWSNLRQVLQLRILLWLGGPGH